jgi:hypothetical protein
MSASADIRVTPFRRAFIVAANGTGTESSIISGEISLDFPLEKKRRDVIRFQHIAVFQIKDNL